MILDAIGVFFILVGVLFSVLGVVGLLRLPDTYTRLHASGKTGTLGVVFICLGTGFFLPDAALKLLGLVIFIVFTGPVGSHAIAAAVHRRTELRDAEAREIAEADMEISGLPHVSELRETAQADAER